MQLCFLRRREVYFLGKSKKLIQPNLTFFVFYFQWLSSAKL